jgi:hypothetical protein
MRRGWWRRNVWGLVLVLPLTAGLFAGNADALYRMNIASEPRDPAPIDADGTAVLDDFQVAIDSFESVSEDDEALFERDITLADSVQAWRAVLHFTGPEKEMGNCTKVALVDAGGRVYPAGPSLLGGLGAIGCLPDETDSPSPYISTVYFLLPAEAQPQTLRIVWEPLLPRYVGLPVAG